jgi:hypothetical protein
VKTKRQSERSLGEIRELTSERRGRIPGPPAAVDDNTDTRLKEDSHDGKNFCQARTYLDSGNSNKLLIDVITSCILPLESGQSSSRQRVSRVSRELT